MIKRSFVNSCLEVDPDTGRVLGQRKHASVEVTVEAFAADPGGSALGYFFLMKSPDRVEPIVMRTFENAVAKIVRECYAEDRPVTLYMDEKDLDNFRLDSPMILGPAYLPYTPGDDSLFAKFSFPN